MRDETLFKKLVAYFMNNAIYSVRDLLKFIPKSEKEAMLSTMDRIETKAEKKGEIKGEKETAFKMRKEGCSIEQIIRLTNLTEQELKEGWMELGKSAKILVI